MLLLPRVNKGFKRALTSLDKAQKAIIAAVVGLGIGLAVASPVEAHTAPSASGYVAQQPANSSMILAAPNLAEYTLAYHTSHASHASHRSHASHYSSR